MSQIPLRRSPPFGVGLLALAGVLLLPSGLHAQFGAPSVRTDWGGFAGLMADAWSEDGAPTGWLAGFRLGFVLNPRWRLVQEVSMGRTGDVRPEGTSLGPDFRNEWLFSLAGVERSLLDHPLNVAAGAGFGVAWRRLERDDPGGSGLSADFRSVTLFSAGVRAERAVLRGIGLSVGLGTRVFGVFSGELRHSPNLEVGVRVH